MSRKKNTWSNNGKLICHFLPIPHRVHLKANNLPVCSSCQTISPLIITFACWEALNRLQRCSTCRMWSSKKCLPANRSNCNLHTSCYFIVPIGGDAQKIRWNAAVWLALIWHLKKSEIECLKQKWGLSMMVMEIMWIITKEKVRTNEEKVIVDSLG